MTLSKTQAPPQSRSARRGTRRRAGPGPGRGHRWLSLSSPVGAEAEAVPRAAGSPVQAGRFSLAPTARRAGLAPASAWRDVCGFPRSSTQHAGDKPRPHRPRQQGGGGAPSEGRGRRRGRSSCQGEHLRLTYRFLKEATATLRRESEAEAPISISGTLQPPHAQALPRWGAASPICTPP